MSRAGRWTLIWDNGEFEALNDYVKLRVDAQARLLFVEDPSTYGRGTIRTINMDKLRSWEPVE